MSEFNELESYVYAVLMQATIGASDEELLAGLKEDGLAPDRAGFILKVAEDIMEIASKHADPIRDLLLVENVDGDESQANVKSFLRQKGVREEYLEHIINYSTFLYSIVMAQHLIADGQKEGKSEKQLIATIKQELEVDLETAQEMYHSALVTENQPTGSESSLVNENTPTSDPIGKKTVIAPLIKGLMFVIAGIVNFSTGYSEGYWSIIVIVVGLVYLTTAIKRRTD